MPCSRTLLFTCLICSHVYMLIPNPSAWDWGVQILAVRNLAASVNVSVPWFPHV